MTNCFLGMEDVLLVLKWPWGPDLQLAVLPVPPFFQSQNQPDLGQKGGAGDYVDICLTPKIAPPPCMHMCLLS